MARKRPPSGSTQVKSEYFPSYIDQTLSGIFLQGNLLPNGESGREMTSKVQIKELAADCVSPHFSMLNSEPQTSRLHSQSWRQTHPGLPACWVDPSI
jgi:hypothetical protein